MPWSLVPRIVRKFGAVSDVPVLMQPNGLNAAHSSGLHKIYPRIDSSKSALLVQLNRIGMVGEMSVDLNRMEAATRRRCISNLV